MRKYILLFFIIVSHSLQAQFRVKDAFPALTFAQPVELTGAGDGTNRLFIVSKPGVIYVLPNSSTVSTAGIFLDMRGKVLTNNVDERGLLGLAFHPAYRQNGYFYVSYNRRPDGARVISRFKISTTNSNLADLTSERILLTYAQPFANHNGGKIAFGKDGHLYIATGDGGSSGDPFNNAQNRTVLLGKMLRIDVNNTSPGLNYAIPADNPYANNTKGFRKEIFAYGLRNPWKFSVDPLTGVIVLGDVGQGLLEEVNVIVKGGNYGWRLKEGSLCYNPAPAPNCDTITGLIPPVYEYGRTPSGGSSITGGFVYRGKIPYLYEKYIYGDFGSGNIWSLTANPADTSVTNQLLLKFPGQISSFGEDDQRELYVCNYSNGKIYKITDEATTLSYLVSPSNGSTTTSTTLYLNTVPGATSYTLQVSTSPDFTTGILTKTTAGRMSTGTYYASFPELSAGQTYYVRVKTNLSPNWGRTTSFTTATAESYSFITSPTHGSTTTSTTLYLNTVPGATSYTLQVSTSPDFTTGILTKTTAGRMSTGTYYASFPELALGQVYYVRVKTNLSPNWGRTISFTTATAESYSFITSPTHGSTTTSTTLYLNTVPGAISYTLQVSTSADFTTGTLTKTTAGRMSTGTYYASFPELSAGQTYYVRVKTNLSPNWGRTTSFTTAGSPVARVASLEEDVNKAYSYINLYPNPFAEYINIQSDTQKDEPIRVTVTDLQGRILSKTSFQANQPIQVGKDLAAGVYILQIMQGEKINTFRIVKSSF